MSTTSAMEGLRAGRGRWQLSLADLSLVVLAAGLGIGIARGSREVWGMRPMGAGLASREPIPISRTAGVAMEIGAVWLAVILARSILGLVRRRGSFGESATPTRLMAAMAWRGLAIVILLALALGESRILRLSGRESPVFFGSSRQLTWSSWYEVRVSLIPVCGVLAIVGLALASGAGVIFSRPGPTRSRPYWLYVPAAALAAVLLVGRPGYWCSLITHLVVVALEAVNNAQRPAYQLTSESLSVRLLRAGIEALPAALTCLGLALIVARDFECTRLGRPWATTPRGWSFRLASMAAALATGAFVLVVALPTVQPHLARALLWTLEPDAVGLILAGFGLFSAGLAARSLFPPASEARSPLVARGRIAAYSVLMAGLLIAIVQSVPTPPQLGPAAPYLVERACDLIYAGRLWFWDQFPYSIDIDLASWFEPERLGWILATTGVAVLVLELGFSRAVGRQPAPFDALVNDPGRLGRFAWLTGALTTVSLVALPTLIVLGQAIVHILVRLEDWSITGWPSPF